MRRPAAPRGRRAGRRSRRARRAGGTCSRTACGAAAALLGRQLEGREQRVGGPLHVERVDAERPGAELLVGAGVLGEDDHAVALVHQRSLLRHEVHAVCERVHEQNVVVLVPGHCLGEVIVNAQVDGLPGVRAVAVVDLARRRAGWRPGIRRTPGCPAATGRGARACVTRPHQVRVLRQQAVEGVEAAHDVLRGVRAVDPQDHALGPRAQHRRPRPPARRATRRAPRTPAGRRRSGSRAPRHGRAGRTVRVPWIDVDVVQELVAGREGTRARSARCGSRRCPRPGRRARCPRACPSAGTRQSSGPGQGTCVKCRRGGPRPCRSRTSSARSRGGSRARGSRRAVGLLGQRRRRTRVDERVGEPGAPAWRS